MQYEAERDTAVIEVRRLRRERCNLGKNVRPVGFIICDEGLIFCDAPESGEARPERVFVLDKATNLLEKMLSDGPCPLEDIKAAAEQANVSWSTIRRAYTSLGVVSSRADGTQAWNLP